MVKQYLEVQLEIEIIMIFFLWCVDGFNMRKGLEKILESKVGER
jgi:hypothetical protein